MDTTSEEGSWHFYNYTFIAPSPRRFQSCLLKNPWMQHLHSCEFSQQQQRRLTLTHTKPRFVRGVYGYSIYTPPLPCHAPYHTSKHQTIALPSSPYAKIKPAQLSIAIQFRPWKGPRVAGKLQRLLSLPCRQVKAIGFPSSSLQGQQAPISCHSKWPMLTLALRQNPQMLGIVGIKVAQR
jgi:hypothetical protein